MLESVAGWVIHIISTLGYPGIVLTMAIESALIPLPSEIIMPFSGFLVSTGRFELIWVGVAGALGNVLGSLAAYALGYWGHEKLVRRFVRKWGKWILLGEEELDKAEELLHKYKDLVVLGSRVVPGVRTVISLPAGFAKLPLGRFIVLTFIGSFIWSLFLAWVGFTMGENWDTLGPYFHKADALIILVVLGLGGFYVYRKVKGNKSRT
ncbi:MAG: DedA [Candidatus Daviesbacteria bacterium GW2011_GWA2_42_7]|uniref:DedA n=1 Tax=Candidatus Daviesbacteria bacterium GW2011_GWA2_42_7 TaxID=1618425 RepID=A0A0G1BBI2_9BACT|nr:MAG: DedA [Candidatus Daviesbacteria bacterium GW2011_GWA2_42_7]